MSLHSSTRDAPCPVLRPRLRRWRRPLLAISAIAWMMLLVGCRSTHPPDLGAIYSRSASAEDLYRNPVIVIPGLVGSRLEDQASGKVVWGAFGGKGIDIRQPADQRLFALPMDPTADFAALRDSVQPTGVLDSIQVRLAGLPLQLKAYYEILKTLGIGGYRDASIKDIDYGEEHFTCFQFAYDWRRDNVENAQRLAAFIEAKRAYVEAERRKIDPNYDRPVKFDLIAHSMGGVLSRYYLRYGDQDLPADGSLPEVTWAGARSVEKLVIIGTPNAGALEAVIQLIEGRKFGPTPRYQPTLLATFPSGYQLLPRTRHQLVVDDAGQAVDLMDVNVWRHYRWGIFDPSQDDVLAALLPDVPLRSDRLDIAENHVRKSLERARHFQAALDLPAQPPVGTRLVLFAGDSVPTDRKAVAQTGRVVMTETAPGDGKVLRSSALMDERIGQEWTPMLRSPIVWSDVNFLFDRHLGLTQNPLFTDNLLYLLLESPR